MDNSEINEDQNETKVDRHEDEARERLLARRAVEERESIAQQDKTSLSPRSNDDLSHLHPQESIERIRSAASRLEKGRAVEYSDSRRGETTEHRERPEARFGEDGIERRQPHEIARLRAEKEAERIEDERRQDIHEKNYHEMIEKTSRGEIEFDAPKEAYVKVDDILLPERAGEWTKLDTPEFWNRHGNSPEFYWQMAEKYPELRERIGRGETLDQIKADETMRVPAEFWYGKGRLVDLDKYQDSHFIGQGGYHRYLLGRKFKLGEIPAQVHEARPKGQQSG